jgi:hypothetical protein
MAVSTTAASAFPAIRLAPEKSRSSIAVRH